MENIIYDGTFHGLLTAIFEVYEHKFKDVNISTEKHVQPGFFGQQHIVETEIRKSERVWTGLKSKLSATAQKQLYHTFLSEEKDIENCLLRYVQYAFSAQHGAEHNYGNADVLKIVQTDKKVRRERHRMEAFIRFQLTKDNLYYAICQPDFNVLPLIEKHFKDRYADQRWMIYDAARKYGIYYDLDTVERVEINFSEEANNGVDISKMYDDSEDLYQMLWQQYFKSVNIVARKNTKLHIQHMPKRYWKFLIEKQPAEW
jgi:probable DNA metabolism protein